MPEFNVPTYEPHAITGEPALAGEPALVDAPVAERPAVPAIIPPADAARPLPV